MAQEPIDPLAITPDAPVQQVPPSAAPPPRDFKKIILRQTARKFTARPPPPRRPWPKPNYYCDYDSHESITSSLFSSDVVFSKSVVESLFFNTRYDPGSSSGTSSCVVYNGAGSESEQQQQQRNGERPNGWQEVHVITHVKTVKTGYQQKQQQALNSITSASTSRLNNNGAPKTKNNVQKRPRPRSKSNSNSKKERTPKDPLSQIHTNTESTETSSTPKTKGPPKKKPRLSIKKPTVTINGVKINGLDEASTPRGSDNSVMKSTTTTKTGDKKNKNLTPVVPYPPDLWSIPSLAWTQACTSSKTTPTTSTTKTPVKPATASKPAITKQRPSSLANGSNGLVKTTPHPPQPHTPKKKKVNGTNEPNSHQSKQKAGPPPTSKLNITTNSTKKKKTASLPQSTHAKSAKSSSSSSFPIIVNAFSLAEPKSEIIVNHTPTSAAAVLTPKTKPSMSSSNSIQPTASLKTRQTLIPAGDPKTNHFTARLNDKNNNTRPNKHVGLKVGRRPMSASAKNKLKKKKASATGKKNQNGVTPKNKLKQTKIDGLFKLAKKKSPTSTSTSTSTSKKKSNKSTQQEEAAIIKTGVVTIIDANAMNAQQAQRKTLMNGSLIHQPSEVRRSLIYQPSEPKRRSKTHDTTHTHTRVHTTKPINKAATAIPIPIPSSSTSSKSSNTATVTIPSQSCNIIPISRRPTLPQPAHSSAPNGHRTIRMPRTTTAAPLTKSNAKSTNSSGIRQLPLLADTRIMVVPRPVITESPIDYSLKQLTRRVRERTPDNVQSSQYQEAGSLLNSPRQLRTTPTKSYAHLTKRSCPCDCAGSH